MLPSLDKSLKMRVKGKILYTSKDIQGHPILSGILEEDDQVLSSVCFFQEVKASLSSNVIQELNKTFPSSSFFSVNLQADPDAKLALFSFFNIEINN